MNVDLFDDRVCALGEGPLWHPERSQLFWFDILGKRMLSRDATGPLEWQFDEHVSAAGWVDRDTLVIASETALSRLDLTTGESEYLTGLEVDTPGTRSNDGRADPFGGFWISTMGLDGASGAGSIYRWYRGGLERLFTGLTIPNAIAFSPDRTTAYFTDTPTRQIMRQALDGEGWPRGAPELFVDLRRDKLNPDGAVVDAEGCLWNAQWGAGRVACYGPDGSLVSAVEFPAEQISCPAFGGDGPNRLFATSAADGATDPAAGQTFVATVAAKGQNEHKVEL